MGYDSRGLVFYLTGLFILDQNCLDDILKFYILNKTLWGFIIDYVLRALYWLACMYFVIRTVKNEKKKTIV